MEFQSQVTPDGRFVLCREQVRDALDELRPIHEAHWHETEMYRAGIGFNPDYERLFVYESSGAFHLFTAREVATGKLAGNIGMYVQPSMHTKKLVATEDTLFILPEYRGGRLAFNFIKYVENCLKSIGVTEVRASTKTVNQAGRLLELSGFTHTANVYTKVLEN